MELKACYNCGNMPVCLNIAAQKLVFVTCYECEMSGPSSATEEEAIVAYNAVASAVEEARWRPYPAETPPYQGCYIVSLRVQDSAPIVTTRYFWIDGTWETCGDPFYKRKIIAWRPMPKPFKEAQE